MSIDKKKQFVSLGNGGDCIYANTLYGSCIYKLNPKNLAATYLASPGDGLPMDYAVSSVFIEDGNKLFMVDKKGDIVIFDLVTRKCTCIDDCVDIHREDDLCYVDALKTGNHFLIFHKFGTYVTDIDLSTKEMRKYELLDGYEYNYDSASQMPLPSFCASFRSGKEIQLLTGDGSMLVSYDLISGEKHSEKISDNHLECASAVYRDKKIYVLDRYGNVYVSESGRNLELFSECKGGDYLEFYDIVATDLSLWLLPGRGTKIVKIDTYSGKRSIYSDISDIEYNTTVDIQLKFYIYTRTRGTYLFANPTTEKLLQIDEKTDEIKWVSVDFNNDTARFEAELKKGNGMIREDVFQLEDLIRMVGDNSG